MKTRRIVFLMIFLPLLMVQYSISFAQTHSYSQSSVLPTASEIKATNARLPVMVADGTMWTKVEYDRATKTERFYYKLTQPVDERIITPSVLNQLKTNMKNALRQNSSSIKRVNAGMTYLYLYYSSDNRKLYEIKINKSDF